ncbi:MAG: hypothetical protein PHH77_10585 [Victivallaceae bacterium]|nr:hypothetical protein [Victivallaceae bacterium]
MLKLNASYSKKVPAEGEYSSQSYHASVEVELPDGLSPDQLQNKIHETFELVRNSVEMELSGPPSTTAAVPAASPGKNDPPASPKQLGYLLDLARGIGMNPQQIAARFQVGDIKQLTRQQCSKLIDEINGRAA